MTAIQGVTDTVSEESRCGCCGHVRPRRRLTELGETPGTFICAGCAFWAVRRTSPMGVGLPQINLRNLGRLGRRRHDGAARMAIPILPSTDFDRTTAFYPALGFTEGERYDGYLLLHSGPVELLFSDQLGGATTPGSCFIHVNDAVGLWKQLRESGLVGVGSPEQTSYGLCEFDVTDPDGNRIRIGSPASQ